MAKPEIKTVDDTPHFHAQFIRMHASDLGAALRRGNLAAASAAANELEAYTLIALVHANLKQNRVNAALTLIADSGAYARCDKLTAGLVEDCGHAAIRIGEMETVGRAINLGARVKGNTGIFEALGEAMQFGTRPELRDESAPRAAQMIVMYADHATGVEISELRRHALQVVAENHKSPLVRAEAKWQLADALLKDGHLDDALQMLTSAYDDKSRTGETTARLKRMLGSHEAWTVRDKTPHAGAALQAVASQSSGPDYKFMQLVNEWITHRMALGDTEGALGGLDLYADVPPALREPRQSSSQASKRYLRDFADRTRKGQLLDLINSAVQGHRRLSLGLKEAALEKVARSRRASLWRLDVPAVVRSRAVEAEFMSAGLPLRAPMTDPPSHPTSIPRRGPHL